MDPRPLGRIPPTNNLHLLRFPLTAATVPDRPTPVVLGTWWFPEMDEPVWDRGGFWRIPRVSPTSRPRGGHAYCLKPDGLSDPSSWHRYYDQGREGACCGYAASRMMSLLNRRRYDAGWLYRTAQVGDEFADTPPEQGTSVRATMDVLRKVGHRQYFRNQTRDVDDKHGIIENRWATSTDEIIGCLGSPRFASIGRVPVLNSWGFHGPPTGTVWNVAGWPHVAWMDVDQLDWLVFRRDGEATVVTDRP